MDTLAVTIISGIVVIASIKWLQCLFRKRDIQSKSAKPKPKPVTVSQPIEISKRVNPKVDMPPPQIILSNSELPVVETLPKNSSKPENPKVDPPPPPIILNQPGLQPSGTVSKEVSVDFKWNLPFHTLFSQPKTTILNYKQDVHIYYQYTSCASKWQLGFGDAERHQDTVVPQITWLETTKHTDVKVKLTMNVLLLQTSNYMQYNDTKFSAADHCVETAAILNVPIQFYHIQIGTGVLGSGTYSAGNTYWIQVNIVITYTYNDCLMSTKRAAQAAFTESATARALSHYKSFSLSEDTQIIKLVCKDQKEIKTAKSILTANSTVFESMFRCDMQEATTGIVNIPDIQEDVMQLLILLWISGKLPENWSEPEIIENLTYAASKYNQGSLLVLLDNLLGDEELFETNIRLLELADKFQLGKASKSITLSLARKAASAQTSTEIFALLGEKCLLRTSTPLE